ncbi:DUF4307 domain-containing protein [Mycolicibacillus trivialis]
MTQPASPGPGSRYGRRRLPGSPRRRVIIAVSVLAIAAGTVIAVLGYQRFGSDDVSGKLVAYELIDDETVSVTITVTRSDPARPAQCIVRVRAKDGSETGRREVLVPPSSQATVVVTTELKSSAKPAMGDIYGCGTEVPDYLRSS